MKKLVLFLLLTSTVAAFAAFPKYRAERLITDYAGAVSNGNVILCYGDFGIITYSFDNGETWKQFTIGDEHSIKKIIYRDGFFYGASAKAIFKSSGNPEQWQILKLYDEPVILDMLLDGEFIAALDSSGIKYYDFELNPLPGKSIAIPQEKKGKMFAKNDENYYILPQNDSAIIKYEITTGKIDKIILPLRQNFLLRLHDIKILNNEIYVLGIGYGFDDYPAAISNSLFKLTNDTTWDLAASMRGTLAYHMSDSKLRYFTLQRNKGFQQSGVYYEIVDKSNSFIINTEDTLNFPQYDIPETKVQDNFIYNIIEIKNGSYLACGANKMIWTSGEGGHNWVPKSYFRRNIDDNTSNEPEIYVINDSIVAMPQIFQRVPMTYDGGATWSLTGNNVNATASGYNVSRYYGRDGFFINIYYNIEEFLGKGHNISISNDYGRSYIFFQDTSLFNPQSYDEEAIEYGGRFLINFFQYIDSSYAGKLFFINKSGEVVEKIKHDTIAFKDILVDPVTGDLIALGARARWNGAKVISAAALYRSKDTAKSWTIEQYLPKLNEMGMYYSPDPYKWKNQLIIPSLTYWNKNVYFYDLETKKLDSIEGSYMSGSVYLKKYFEINGILWTYYNGKLYPLNLEERKAEADSIPMSYFFPDWSASYDELKRGKDELFSIQRGDSVIYAEIGKSTGSATYGGTAYKINILKFTPISETIIEEIKASEPLIAYPNPCKDQINIDLSSVSGADFYEIYNILGLKIASASILPGESVLRLSLTSYPQGEYFILINSEDSKAFAKAVLER